MHQHNHLRLLTHLDFLGTYSICVPAIYYDNYLSLPTVGHYIMCVIDTCWVWVIASKFQLLYLNMCLPCACLKGVSREKLIDVMYKTNKAFTMSSGILSTVLKFFWKGAESNPRNSWDKEEVSSWCKPSLQIIHYLGKLSGKWYLCQKVTQVYVQYMVVISFTTAGNVDIAIWNNWRPWTTSSRAEYVSG